MNSLFRALDDGAVIITANRRLAGHFWRLYDARQQAAGRTLWPSPRILPYAAWLRERWEAGLEVLAERGEAPPGTLLAVYQVEVLWERIITESPVGRELLHPAGAARLAGEAWSLLRRWRLKAPAPSRAGSAETRAFAAWSARFAEICRREGWLVPDRLPELLEGWFGDGTLPVPRRLVHAGFDEIPPQQKALFDVLAERGCDLSPYDAPSRRDRVVRTAFPDEEGEIEAAARWTRHLLQTGEGPATIGVVVPDLPSLHGRVERIFADVLVPGELIGEPGSARPFNLSTGVALAKVPVIRDALEWLEPVARPIPLSRIGALLRSPYLNGAERELTARAQLFSDLGRWGTLELDWRRVREAAGRPRSREGDADARCPVLAQVLALREALERQTPASQHAAAWAGHFGELLRAAGWPGERGLDHVEYQAIQAWGEVLGDLARLELVLPPLRHGGALARLRRLAAERIFQPKSEAAPVQILGVLEAGGLHFDHLWLLGFHDGIWPAPPRPNPFLPLALQREHDLPHATARRELAFAWRETERLLGSAPDVVVSHALKAGEADRRISPLLAGLPHQSPEGLPRGDTVGLVETVRRTGGVEPLSDFQVPPIGETRHWPGGVGIYRDQSACPFRAFAVHRLHARALAGAEAGLSATDRGGIVHRAVELLWEALESHERLCQSSAEGLREIVADSVQRALADFIGGSRHPDASRLLEVEKARVADLLSEWLVWERKRRPFTVDRREKRQVAAFGGIEVDTRIDRIDRLESGGRVIIDYKTGPSAIGSWFGDRPDEPQLPLYCSSAGLAIAGVAFAQVSREGMGFKGLAADPEILPAAKPFERYVETGSAERDTPSGALLGRWTGVLEALGNAFRSGDARVDPKDPRKTCRHCDLPALCRIHELVDLADPDGNEEEADG